MMIGSAIGIVELSGISKGYQVLDAMMKSSNVHKLIARTICSGKYFITVSGSVSDVDHAISVAVEHGKYAIINARTIPNIDPQVFPAIAGVTVLDKSGGNKSIGALLIIETYSVVTAITAADMIVKEANVNLLRVHVAMAVGGKGFVVATGDISDLEAALDATKYYFKVDGMLVDTAIIKNPHKDMLKELL